VAIAAGDRFAETELLNTLGMAYVSLGDVDKGVTSLERAVALAREDDDFDSLSTAYSNLADMYALAGRTREALETAQTGLAATPSHHVRSHLWITLTVAEMSFAASVSWWGPRWSSASATRMRPLPVWTPPRTWSR
jgi:tetratricopeptide (TPR) repeat protein